MEDTSTIKEHVLTDEDGARVEEYAANIISPTRLELLKLKLNRCNPMHTSQDKSGVQLNAEKEDQRY